jgi:tetratricopeptide (TPR) repeat protein
MLAEHSTIKALTNFGRAFEWRANIAMVSKLVTLGGLVWLVASLLMAQETQQPPSMEQGTAAERIERARSGVPERQPLTQDDVLDLIKKNKDNLDVVYKTLDERKVNFDLDRKIEQKMRKAGADDVMLQAIWKAGPTGRSEKAATLTSATGAPLQATYEEAMGFKTMEHEPDPDKRLRMVDEFESRFPKSQFLSYVYLQAAKACQEKGDLNKLVEYGEKSLKQDPDNVFSLVMVALTLPQPRMLQGSPGEAAQRLSLAETYANRALKLIDSLPARTNESPEQLQKRKAALASDAHTALGMVCMDRDESPKAIEELKTAVSLTQTPNPQLYFRLGEVYENEGKKNEAFEAFTKASELGHGTVLQQYADQRIAELKKK